MLVFSLLAACALTEADGTGPTLIPELTSRLDGTLTWTVDYDEAAGRSDCSYSRAYTATQNDAQRWVCPECTTVWRAEVELLDPEDCYDELTGGRTPNPIENLGRAGDLWYRSGNHNAPLTEQGTVSAAEGTYSVVNETPVYTLSDGSSYRFLVSGQLELTVEPGSALQGFDERPNSCGWELQPAPRYDGDYRLVEGETVPDGFFLDACNEAVRLHELGGSYLVIDISAMNCPPCQDMAADTPAFLQRMQDAGAPTRTVTLLAPSLSAVLGDTTTAQLLLWANEFELDEPILADRGWGYALAGGLLGPDFAYPTSIVVGPDLEVLAVYTGFNSYARFETLIKEHAGVD